MQNGVNHPLDESIKLADFRALVAPYLAPTVCGTPLLGRLHGTPSRLNTPMKGDEGAYLIHDDVYTGSTTRCSVDFNG
jgi:hypothetical protein